MKSNQHILTIANVQEINKVTWVGVIINVVLSAIKFVVGYIGGSHAVIADAVHSLSDLATDFAVIVGVRFWSAPPDQDHHYGHYRIEALITALIGIILGFVAIGIGYSSVVTIKEFHFGKTAWIAVIGPLASIFIKEVLYHWTVAVGKKVRSKSLIANAWHHRSDALSSIPALIAVVVSTINPSWVLVDHIGALVVSVFILKVAWDITVPALLELTDQGASENVHVAIKQIALAVEGVREVHKIRTRKIGQNIFVDLHVLVRPEITVRDGHAISENVKHELLKKGPDILDAVIHLEPAE